MCGRPLPLRLAAALMAGILVLPLGVALLCGSTPADMGEMPGMQDAQHQTATHAEDRVSTPGVALDCVSVATCASQQPTAFAAPIRFEPAGSIMARNLALRGLRIVGFIPPPSTPPPKA